MTSTTIRRLPILLLALAALFLALPGVDAPPAEAQTTVTMSINDVTVDEDAGTATLTISLSPSTGCPINTQHSVSWSTADDSAVDPSDYTHTIELLRFSSCQNSKTITVDIVDDSELEDDEEFKVMLTYIGSPATIADGTGVVTINDDDTATVSIPPDMTISEGIGVKTLAVKVDADSCIVAFPFNVDFSVTSRTATAGQDFKVSTSSGGSHVNSGTLRFAACQLSKTLYVTVLDDSKSEARPESFSITLSRPASLDPRVIFGKASTTVRLYDDEPPVDPGWSATLTAGKRTTHSGYVFSIGCDNIAPSLGQQPTIKSCGTSSVLTDDDFAYAGKTYWITKLVYDPDHYNQGNDELEIVLSPPLEDIAFNLMLVVDGKRLNFADADEIWHVPDTDGQFPEFDNRSSLKWVDPGFEWAYQDTVELSLSDPGVAATLSGLILKPEAIDQALSPTFDYLETNYMAHVANRVSDVTVIPTPTYADATVAYLDGGGALLDDPDGDANNGHQVDLDVGGGNTFKVEVTAEDGVTTKTYTVTVYREALDGIWSANLTAEGAINAVGCDNTYSSTIPALGIPACSSSNVLTDDRFTHEGTIYSVTSVLYSPLDDPQTQNYENLAIETEPTLTGSALNLILVVDGTPFAFDDADRKEDSMEDSDSFRSWHDPDITWSAGQWVSLELREPPPVEDTLVSNTDPYWQPGGPMAKEFLIRAQAFTTGLHTAKITSIGVQFNGFPAGTNPEAELKATLNDGGKLTGRRAGEELCKLTSPERHDRFITWQADDDCPQLKPNTKYRFVLTWQDTGTDYDAVTLDRTPSPNEDARSNPGWTIANSRHLYYWDLDNNTRYWRTDEGFSLILKIDGYEIESSLSVPPDSPEGMMITNRGPGMLGMSWNPSTNDGGSEINGYTVEYEPTGGKPSSEDAGQEPFGTRNAGRDDTRSIGKRSTGDDGAPEGGSVDTTDTSVVITGLTDGVEYELRVIAHNEAGSSPPSDPVTGTPGQALEAEFPASTYSSRSHAGDDDSPQVVVAFSQEVASFTASTPSVAVVGGAVTSVQSHEEPGLENAYLFFLDPSGNDDIEFSLVANRACDAGGICTEDGTTLSVVPAMHTIPGPAPANTPATGAPTISGRAQVGRTLTADISGIEDDDGVANAVYTYQWLADDTEIAGATDRGYTLADADEGRAVKVKVSFTDDVDNDESLTSAATTAVVSAAGPLAGFTLVDASDQSVAANLTAGTALTLDDPADGSYGIRADTETGAEIGSVRLELSGAKTVAQTENYAPYSLYGDDNDGLHGEGLPTGAYTLRATAYSDSGLSGDDLGTLEVSFTVADSAAEEVENTPATGAPTISGTAQVGETLTVSVDAIEDDDGIANAEFSYQWLADGAEITDATGGSYTLVDADAGKAIKVRASFTDDEGNAESLTSAATAVVEEAEPTEPPPKPTNLTARVNGDGSITLSWEAPDDDSVTGYQILRRRPTQGEDTPLVYVEDTGSTATTYTDTNVTAGVRHVYRVKAINSAGVGAQSNYVNPTP